MKVSTHKSHPGDWLLPENMREAQNAHPLGKAKEGWGQDESAAYSKRVWKIQMLKVAAPNSNLLMQQKAIYWLTHLGRMLGTVAVHGIKGTGEEPGPADGSWNSEVIISSATQTISISFYLIYLPWETLSLIHQEMWLSDCVCLPHTSTTKVVSPSVHKGRGGF